MIIRDTITNLRKIITVEPIVGIFMFAYIGRLIPETVFLFSKKDNDSIISYSDELIHIGENLLTELVLPITILSLLGSFSDKHNLRKPFLLAPLLGEIIVTLGRYLCWVSPNKDPEFLYFYLRLVHAFFGGAPLLVVASFAYLADVTDVKTRTFRFAMLAIVTQAAVSSLLYFEIFLRIENLKTSVQWICVNCGLLLAALVYGIFWIQEPRPVEGCGRHLFYDIFNLRHVVETVKTQVTKPASSLMVFMFLVAVCYGLQGGFEMAFVFLDNRLNYCNKVKRNALKSFLVYYSGIRFAGITVFSLILIKILQVDDLLILLVNLAFLVISNIFCEMDRSLSIFYAGDAFFYEHFAVTVTVITVGGTVKLISFVSAVTFSSVTLIPTVSASILTKSVSKVDYGKVLVLLRISCITGVIATFFINRNSSPIVFFRLCTVIYAIFTITMLCLYFKNKREEQSINANQSVV